MKEIFEEILIGRLGTLPTCFMLAPLRNQVTILNSKVNDDNYQINWINSDKRKKQQTAVVFCVGRYFGWLMRLNVV